MSSQPYRLVDSDAFTPGLPPVEPLGDEAGEAGHGEQTEFNSDNLPRAFTTPEGFMHGPSPDDPHPMAGFPQVGFLKSLVKNPLIEVGDYSYYDDTDGPEHFEAKCVLYHFPFIGDKLIIGKFCALARGVRFLMNGANHRVSGFSTYPFFIFGAGWEGVTPRPGDLPYKGDTIIGNDVWVGYDALVLPGVRIGDGAIVAARSVVTGDVPPYSVVGGNPAAVVKRRFPDEVVAELMAIRWWDWPVERITRNLPAIVGADLDALRTEAP